MESFRFDLRVRHIETRELREGNALLLQGRTNIANMDGSIEEGTWITTGTIPNYGDCFDKKRNWLQRLLNK